MKIYPIIISQNFLKSHRRAGEETGFIEKIIDGRKKHTVRMNYKYWAKRVETIQAHDGVLSVRSWSGKPYKSPQDEFLRIPTIGIEPLSVINKRIYINGKAMIHKDMMELAKNDGFDYSPEGLRDFIEWLGADKEDVRDACIIHFTHFRYD